jgi:Flp pilus assembly protein CpaB
MRKLRGVVALIIAVGLGLLAVKAVNYQLHRSRVEKKEKIAVVAVAADEKTVLSIPSGMREVTLRVDEVTGISRDLKTGDRVDVIATTPLPGSNAGHMSRIILENARVYRVAGGSTEVAKRLVTQKKTWTVSLIVLPESAAMLTAAAGQAEITLMARRSETGDAYARNTPSDTKARDKVYLFNPEKGPCTITVPRQNMAGPIPDHMRVVTLDMRETDGFCGVLRAGDRVDVILSTMLGAVDAQGDYEVGSRATITEKRKKSVMLLQNVLVWGTKNVSVLPGSGSSPVPRVMLLVSARDAMKLTVARDVDKKSRLRLIARNKTDSESCRMPDIFFNDLLLKMRESTRVRVFRGNQRSIRPFYN